VSPDRSRKPIRHIFLVREGDDLRARFVVDSRRYDSIEEAREVANEAAHELDVRRVPGEQQVDQVHPTSPFSKLPEWSEYKVDIDDKHPLPERHRTGTDEGTTGS
jgi:hypothetical protein